MVGFNPNKMPHKISEFAKAEFAKLDKNGNGKIDSYEMPNSGTSIFSDPYSVLAGDTIEDFIQRNSNKLKRKETEQKTNDISKLSQELLNKKEPPKAEE